MTTLVGQPVISTTSLTKSYGRSRGIIDVDLEVRAGEVFGFLGPNGAGKTTTIRLLLDLIRPTRGSARVFGLDVHGERIAIHRRVSYLSGELSLWGDLTGAQLLTYLANLRGGVDPAEIRRLSERLQVELDRRFKTLSRGNKQKIGLVAAFMARPELVILDEPTSGLDPIVQQEFERLVEEVRADGRTVFLSSHILPEVEHLCDRVGIIREGRLVTVEAVAELKRRALRRLELDFAAAVPPDPFRAVPGVRDVEVHEGVVRCTVQGSLDALVKLAARYEVIDLHVVETSLEEIFLAYYGEEMNGHAAA
ncbi:MAG TPA: ABC transporter ATP-binding protein [Candidatus Limnocylindrales bacterium]